MEKTACNTFKKTDSYHKDKYIHLKMDYNPWNREKNPTLPLLIKQVIENSTLTVSQDKLW